jgi:microcystin-dependent protein
MSEPFLSEIRLFSFEFAPKGWALCNGQFLPINQNQGLFSLLGTTFGGNGQTNFTLPDLRGRTPIHAGPGYILGQKGGEQNHTVSLQELPAHTHLMQASSSNANQPAPDNAVLAAANNAYQEATDLTQLNPGTVTNVGGSQPHLNMQPFLTLSFCIALQGYFPSQT